MAFSTQFAKVIFPKSSVVLTEGPDKMKLRFKFDIAALDILMRTLWSEATAKKKTGDIRIAGLETVLPYTLVGSASVLLLVANTEGYLPPEHLGGTSTRRCVQLSERLIKCKVPGCSQSFPQKLVWQHAGWHISTGNFNRSI